MLISKARQILSREWKAISDLANAAKLKDRLDDRTLIRNIRESINSKTKTYRYVLPTQILAKVADHSLDCRCLQASRGGAGAFDARTVAHKVVVPFDQANDSVLGGSPEPYVNNPLRVPEVSRKYRKPQKDRIGWDHLCSVLNVVEEAAQRSFTDLVFRQILAEIYRRLSLVHVVYPTPKRTSLKKAIEIMKTYTSQQSGGDRLLALASSLFVTIGKRFGLYSQVRRGKITAADQASGMLTDLECVTEQREIVLAVEVKDRQITVSQFKGKMRTIRQKQVSEIFFLAQEAARSEQKQIENLVQHEFASGHNVYIADLYTLARMALALLGEQGRRDFLIETGHQLEEYGSDISHRRAWAGLLESA